MTRASGSSSRVPRWFLVLGLLILTAPLVQFVLNATPVRAVIQRQVARATGIEAADFRIRLLPRLHVELLEVVVHGPGAGEPVFRARRVDLAVELAPLLRRDVTLAEVRVIAPHVRVHRDGQGRWHLPLASSLTTAFDATQPSAGGAPLRFPRIEIAEGEALVVDEQAGTVPDTIRVSGLQLTVIEHDRGRSADVGVMGFLDGQTGPASFSVTGSVVALDRSKSSGSGGGAVVPVQFSGQVEVRGLETKGWRRRLGVAALTDRSGQVDLTAKVVIGPGTSGYDLTWSQAEVRLDWLAVRGEGSVQGLGTDQARYAVAITSTPFTFATLAQRVPVLWVDPRIQTFVIEHEGAGTLEVITATVQGRIGAPEIDEWKGVAKLTDGHAVLGTDHVPLDGLTGTVFFNQHTIESADVRGAIGPIRITHGKVTLSHVQVAPTLDVEMAGEAAAEDVLDRLSRMGEMEGHRRLLQSIAEARGALRLSVVLTGQLVPEPRVGLVKADIAGHDLRLRSTRWSETLEEGTVDLQLRPSMLEIRRAHARIGAVSVEAAGAVQVEPRPAFDQVTVRLEADGDRLLRVLSSQTDDEREWTLHGPLHASARLEGAFSAPRFVGMVELDRAAIGVPPVVQKQSGVPAAVEFAGAYSSARGLRFSQLDVRLPFVRLHGRAAARLDDPRTFRLHLNAGPVSILRLADAFVIRPFTKGVVQAVLDAEGRWTEWPSARLTGWVEMSRGRMQVDSLRDDVRSVAGRVHLTGHEALIERLAFKLGESDVAVRGTVKRWRREPDMLLAIESSKLDLSRVLADERAPTSAVPVVERLRRWTRTMHGEVGLRISQARYHRLLFRELSGRVRIGEGRLGVDRVSGDTNEGTLKGECGWDLRDSSYGRFTGQFTIDGLPIHQVISLFEQGEEILTGMLSATGRLELALEPSLPFWRRLSTLDPLAIRVEDGRLLRGAVMPKILKILNLPALLKERVDLDEQGFPFDSLSATVAIRDGVLDSQNLALNSPVMKMSGAGTYDVLTDRLNASLAISPLGAYSDLVGKIPLFGQLLAGDRPGLTTALFEVKGPRDNPEVQYLPIGSLAKGLTGYPQLAIDVLHNLVTLPQKVTTPHSP